MIQEDILPYITYILGMYTWNIFSEFKKAKFPRLGIKLYYLIYKPRKLQPRLGEIYVNITFLNLLWTITHLGVRQFKSCMMSFAIGCSLLQDAYSEVASLFAEFFRDLDIVPSDIIAGLVLLRQRQRSKRSSILDQVKNK